MGDRPHVSRRICQRALDVAAVDVSVMDEPCARGCLIAACLARGGIFAVGGISAHPRVGGAI
jgi:hypothetical protein